MISRLMNAAPVPALPPAQPMGAPQPLYGQQQPYHVPMYGTPADASYQHSAMAQGSIVELPSPNERVSLSSNAVDQSGAEGRNGLGGSSHSHAGQASQQSRHQHQHSTSQAPLRQHAHHQSPVTKAQTLPQSVFSQGASSSSRPRHGSVNHLSPSTFSNQPHTSSNVPANSSTVTTVDHSRAGALPRATLEQVIGGKHGQRSRYRRDNNASPCSLD